MLMAFMMLFAFQGIRMGGAKQPVPIPDPTTMAQGSLDHFKNGITIFGKLTWPNDMAPSIIDIDLEDVSGIVVDSVKSMPNNEFRFDNVPLVDAFDGHYLTYYFSINTEALDIVRQQLSLTTNNFNGATVTIPLKHAPGTSRTSETVVSIKTLTHETPKGVLDLVDKAKAEEKKNDMKKAAADLQAAIKLAPDAYEPNLEMGLMEQKSRQSDDATKFLNHALELNPASIKARIALGEIAFDKKDFDATADMLSEAVKLGSASADVYLKLGVAYYQTDDSDNAELSLQRALVLAPGLGEANRQLFNVYVKRGQLDRALAELQTYQARHPNAPDRAKVQELSDKIQKTLHP